MSLSSQGPAPTHPATITEHIATEDQIRKPGWWPTKGSAARSTFIGSRECARCHSDIHSAQTTTSMAQTASRASASDLLRQFPLQYKLGPYTYRAAADQQAATYSVTDDSATFSVSLGWAFGIRMGQSFLFDRNGGIFMAPLTYYPEAMIWDFTVDQPHAVPNSLEQAVGRHLTDVEVRGCFNCHNTASTTENKFDAEKSVPGVTCEACHGPGADHQAAAKAGLAELGTTAIFNPRRLSPAQSVDFCGACHRTWWDVTLSGSTGKTSLRFPPYRLINSRCWGRGDARLTCVACHNPHQPLQRNAESYDVNCLSCHVNSPGGKPTDDHPGLPCPAARKACVSCHMPKHEVTDIPVKFTDHQIRIVRPDDPIPK